MTAEALLHCENWRLELGLIKICCHCRPMEIPVGVRAARVAEEVASRAVEEVAGLVAAAAARVVEEVAGLVGVARAVEAMEQLLHQCGVAS